MKKLLCFGSLNIDYTYSVKNFVSAGETVKSFGLDRNIGGKGLNQSIAFAKAGGKVFHAGKIGQDGLFLKDFLDANGVDSHLLKIGNTPTGHAIIQVNEKGGNCIIIHGGANMEITDDYIESVLENFEAGDFLLIQNEINNLRKIVEEAKKRNMTVVLNPSPVEALDVPFEMVDYFILNEHEAEAIFDEADEEKMTEKMLSTYPDGKFVLTLGSKGSIYADCEQTVRVAAKRVEAVDTTAAGDTFTGYFLNGIMTQSSPKEAMEIASRAAAITVSRNGAAESIPRFDEI